MHVIKEPQQPTFERAGVRGKIFSSKNLTDKTEFLIIETETGHETSIIEHKCDFSYYILEGNGYFLINDKKETFEVGDLIVVPAGSKFTYKGKLRMLLNVTPPFDVKQEKVIEETK